MADNNTVVSGTTISPTESASQVGKPSIDSVPSRADGRQKRSHKSAKDKDAPQGAVQVPKAGLSKPAKSTQPQSATIVLSGWGEIDLAPHRNDIEPTFTTDAQPFNDLVTQVWMSIQSRYSSGGKHIPFGLFRYYCMTMWWYRVLFLQRANGNVLTTEQKNFLNVIGAGDEYFIPSHIAQYLANMGNFQQGGETFYFRLQPQSWGSKTTGNVRNGWFLNSSNSLSADFTNWWLYSQLPSPGVYTTYACNEADSVAGGGNQDDLGAIEPSINGYTFHSTDNIVGWSNTPYQACHNSWRSTYYNLGWSGTGLPPDTQTQFNVSTSTLKWMSERLSVMKDFKTHSSKQITLSSHGNPIQVYYLRHDHAHTATDLWPAHDNMDNNTVRATHQYELSLASRFAMDPKLLAPSFSFGYRLERQRIFSKMTKDGPQYIGRSSYQPWFITKDGEGAGNATLADRWYTNMNLTLNYGSGVFMNTPRFGTHSLLRSAALDAALVLSDTK
ncbi:coat protein [Colletotrichum liriopes partitivirus 1]|nr:coat protein [Colletotrichum liriopes partitivirus 1]